METEKLYETDSHLTSCDSLVLDCLPLDQGFGVVLDRTVLFPEGGGQPADTGFLGEVPVTDVRERDGLLLHLTPAPIPVGTAVRCVLDWPRRLDHLQQHTGEHLLSYAFWHLFGVQNIGFHMGAQVVTIDLDRSLTQGELDQAEEFANSQVFANLPLRAYVVPPQEAEALPLRKKTDKAVEALRIVEISGSDCCTCCGTHAQSIGEVGLIKILRQEPRKGGSRVEFVCGGRALGDYRSKNAIALEAGAALSTKDQGVVEGIRRLQSEVSGLTARLREKSLLLTQLYARELLAAAPAKNGCRAVLTCQPQLDGKEAKLLLNFLLEAPGTVAVILTPNGDRLSWLLGKSAGSPADCGYLCDLLGGLYNGKGGGKADFAQGSGRLLPNWQETALSLQKFMLPDS